MNSARQQPLTRPQPTHTFWPDGRRPEPPAAKPPQTDHKRDEEPAGQEHDEPGYGHGV